MKPRSLGVCDLAKAMAFPRKVEPVALFVSFLMQNTIMKVHVKQIAKLASLLCLLGLSNGCATMILSQEANVSSFGTDDFGPIEKAYKSPEQEIFLCVNGTLSGSKSSGAFTVKVGSEKLRGQGASRNPTDPIVKHYNLIVKREAIVAGWLTDAEIEKRKLALIHISPKVLERDAIFDWSSKWWEEYKSITISEDTIFNTTYGRLFAFVYAEVAEVGKPNHFFPAHLDQKVYRQHRYLLIALPLTIALDIATFPISIPLAYLYGMGALRH